MERNGQGAEGLATHLNSYFGLMCRLIAADGGDVFKFAGDACIVLWPDTDDMHTRVLRATQCAWSIQKYLNAADLDKDNNVQLSVKCGIGMGMVSVLHIGGVLNRMEYLAVGEPLLQAFQGKYDDDSNYIEYTQQTCGTHACMAHAHMCRRVYVAPFVHTRRPSLSPSRSRLAAQDATFVGSSSAV